MVHELPWVTRVVQMNGPLAVAVGYEGEEMIKDIQLSDECAFCYAHVNLHLSMDMVAWPLAYGKPHPYRSHTAI